MEDKYDKILPLKNNRYLHSFDNSRKPLYFENTGSASSSQIGQILENKVVQKLKLEKNVFYKKWSLKLIFLNDFFLEKILWIFDIEN